jgi:hypothetical protein
VEQVDHDVDGHEEVLISGRRLNCYISPQDNASVFALEYKPKQYSLSNILMRNPEIYHKDVLNPQARKKKKSSDEPLSIHDIPHATPEEFKELLVYDSYRKNSFITHYLDAPASVEKILKENRIDTSTSAHLPFVLVSKSEGQETVTLAFSGTQGQLKISKTYTYDPGGSITLSHAISPLSENTWIVLEWNIFTLTGERPYVDTQPRENDRGVYRAHCVEIKDTSQGLTVCIKSESHWVVCIVPIECVSQSEEGFEKSFQGWSVYFMLQCQVSVPDVNLKVSEGCRD